MWFTSRIANAEATVVQMVGRAAGETGCISFRLEFFAYFLFQDKK
jgi:hypothetical protein